MPNITAFFDMDRTLLRCNSGEKWLSYLRRTGEISTWKAIRAGAWLLRYKLALVDMEAVTGIVFADMKGMLERELRVKVERWADEEILHHVAPRARERIAWHKERGHLTAILSTSTPFLTEPIADHVGIEHVLCTRPHVDGGVLTGTYDKPACFGAGKVHWAERFARVHDVDLDASFFYTDSYSDLPMLERVGERWVVNPDARLRRHAQRVGWRIEEW
jgi:HAD superfamily hydrolase (TIGR01490 family)